MRRAATLLSIASLAVVLAIVPALSGCGSGGGSVADVGFLSVTANASFVNDYIYRVDVFDGGGLVTSDSLTLDDGFTADLGSYVVGTYDVDIYWTDGASFPRSVDSVSNVNIFLDATTHLTSIEP